MTMCTTGLKLWRTLYGVMGDARKLAHLQWDSGELPGFISPACFLKLGGNPGVPRGTIANQTNRSSSRKAMFHVEQLAPPADFQDHLHSIRDRNWLQPFQTRHRFSPSQIGSLGRKQHEVPLYTL
jgi:hypothetical protein